MIRDVTDGISLLWVLGLLVLAAGSLVALVLRFRRGDNVSRQQIKWLLFAGVVLVIVAISGLAFFSVYSDSPAWLDIIVQIVLMTLPLAVANAILRYRLYDIDIIIRRTLSYSILTAALALIYFGAVALLQYMFGGLFSNSNSPLIIVISTLAIAALFNPLRSRIQAFIDRRFFRSKYDAEKALADFSAVARDEVDIVRLSSSLLSVIEKTIQPEQINLWLRETTREK
jgi:ABC-type Fe3+-siderophore transport system permease subunit